MIATEFIGGSDVQRSLNHSDNQCVNLIPALNDKGDIAAFYAAPGLTLEVTNPASAVGSGIYTASNGRCFEVAGTTLYELTESGGVISTTSRGTVTVGNPIYRMVDNGIEMLLVNGTDGWLFTFETNTLLKIKVSTAEFTVTIADPAVFTKTAHGLVAGDAIRLTSTTGTILSDTLLTALSPSTVSTSTNYPPYDLKISPNGDFAYAAAALNTTFPSWYLFCYSVASDGSLSPLSPPSVDIKGTAPLIGSGYNSVLAISSDGISAHAVGQSATVKTISLNSSTGAATYAYQVATGSTSLAYPTDIKLSPDDAFAYVVNSGENTVSQFSRNLGTGELTALTPATVATGSLPQKIVISDDGLFAYVTNKTGNTITLFSRNAVSGLLTSVSATSCAGTSPIGIALSTATDNPYLYVVNNGTLEVEVFSRNSSTGAITHIASSSIATGTNPQNILVTAESAYVVNVSSATVSQFLVDTSTGLLTAASSPTIAAGASPAGIAISPDGNSVYVCNSSDYNISQYSRNGTATSIGLPTGLSELTTYYVISAGLTADTFEVSETSGGTAVSTSGQQAGVHTYTTLGYGFPEGAKTCSYMNGRFIALEPDTQNFYVSEVLDGSWWDALNVQTVDSNPDYVVGETVSHNELIVFCTDSGEVFYDSGETPSPFVRNTSGTFEVGCVAEYSICNLDNQVFWLGGNKNGKGIVYKLQGFTPMRISTHSIEYAIQSMTDFTDARAFAYQQDGHHFYCITFPTGDKTYCYDVNTGLWHERANFSGTALSRWVAQEHTYFAGKNLVLSYADGKIYSIDPTVYAYGTEARKTIRSFAVPSPDRERKRHNRLILDCELGAGGGGTITGGSVDSVSIINAGTSGDPTLSLAAQTLPSSQTWTGIAWNGSVFCAVSASAAATSPDGVTWTARTFSLAGCAGIAWNGSVFCAVGSGTGAATSPDGITWTARTLPTSLTAWTAITYGSGLFVAIGYINGTSSNCATSPDGITWTARSMDNGAVRPFAIAYSGTMFVVVGYRSSGVGEAGFSSPDGITWTVRALPSNVNWKGVAHDGTKFYAVATTTNGATSTDGITWAAASLPASATWTAITASGSTMVAVNTSGTAYSTGDSGETWVSAGGSGTMSAIAVGGTVWSAVGTGASAYTGEFGYPSAGTYALTFTGGGGSAAAGTYTISASTGQITSTAITNAGTGYTSTPSVSFAYGGISGASGVANMAFTYSPASAGSVPVGMRYSDDAGVSWSTTRYGYLGARGVVWQRLGMTSGLPRIYELSTVDAEKVTLLGVYLD